MKNFTLTDPPIDKDDREAWMTHAAGHIIFEQMRRYAVQRIPKDTDDATREKIITGIDDAIYAYTMLLDGVFSPFSNKQYEVSIDTRILLTKADGEIVHALHTFDTEGMCMAYHGWKEGDFGEDPIYTKGDVAGSV